MRTHIDTDSTIALFLDNHRLPANYKDTCEKWFIPLAERIYNLARNRTAPLIVGINGAQGSGKSTLSSLLQSLLENMQLTTVNLSIDDFYHTAAERHHLGDAVHPLFETRGVPGTHDMKLAMETVDALLQNSGSVKLPRFDKGNDDRFDESQWSETSLPVNVILLEGWCMGTTAQLETELQTPVNEFEQDKDHDGQWRRFVNEQLKDYYAPFFARVDYWVMLKAPDFERVYEWRLEQEQKLAATTGGTKIMNAQQVLRFVQHYERLTRHNLKHLSEQVDEVFELGADREITDHHLNQKH